MEHEFTISGRIFPELNQVANPDVFQSFASKISWVEQDFDELGLKINFTPCDLDDQGEPQKVMVMFSMKSTDIDCAQLEQACLNLSVIFGCTVLLCKDHEAYGVANVFNGGSDYEVVDEDCDLWAYRIGSKIICERTKFWNEKFADLEQDFLKSDAAKAMLNLLKDLA